MRQLIDLRFGHGTPGPASLTESSRRIQEHKEQRKKALSAYEKRSTQEEMLIIGV